MRNIKAYKSFFFHPCMHAGTGLASTNSTDNTTLLLEVNSDIVLFSIQNTSHGISIAVTPLCPNQDDCFAPQSLLIDGIFLPEECTNVPCNEHQLVITKALDNNSTIQYVIGVPTVQSLLLLRFHYHVQSHIFELVEKATVNRGIVQYNCNPTAIVSLKEVYYTLCVNNSENRLIVLEIDNLEKFSDVTFNSVLESLVDINLPITDISVVTRQSKLYILFVGGSELTAIDIGVFDFHSQNFVDCTEIIYRMRLRNDTKSDDTIPYLLYCSENYGLIDIEDDFNPPLSYYYNETGYPVICQERDAIVAQITVFKDGVNSILRHNGTNFTLPGQAISLEDSSCFGFEDTLLYVYSDQDLGTVIVHLQKHILRELLIVKCQPLIYSSSVLNNRYVLQKQEYSDSNITLILYDMQQQKFVAETAIEHSTSLIQLLELPQPQQPDWSIKFTTPLTIGVVVASIIAICVLVIAIIGR